MNQDKSDKSKDDQVVAHFVNIKTLKVVTHRNPTQTRAGKHIRERYRTSYLWMEIKDQEKSDVKVELNAYQMDQIDRQIRVIEAVTALIMSQHPTSKGGCDLINTTTSILSDIMAGEGSDNPAETAESSDQVDYQKGVYSFLKNSAPEIFESEQKSPLVIFSDIEKDEIPPRYFFMLDAQKVCSPVTQDMPDVLRHCLSCMGDGLFIEVQEDDLPYLKKPEGEWEFRRPLKDDKYASMGALEKHGRHLFCHARNDWVDPSKGTWDPLNHYRWCQPKKVSFLDTLVPNTEA